MCFLGGEYYVNNSVHLEHTDRPHVDLKTPAKKVNFRQNPRILGQKPRPNLIYWELGAVNLTRTGSILINSQK